MMDMLGCTDGWLVIFDRNKEKPWDEKIYRKTAIINGKTLNIFGC